MRGTRRRREVFFGVFYCKTVCVTADFSAGCHFSKIPPKIRPIQNMKVLKHANKMLTQTHEYIKKICIFLTLFSKIIILAAAFSFSKHRKK